MIDVTNARLYRDSLQALAGHRRRTGRPYRGRFVQIFLALKFYQNHIPSMFSNQYMATEVLQTLLDDLYSKASRPLNQCVLMLFENSYKARTGLVAPGNRTPQNTWRNNLHLQKGVGCYAPVQDLSSQTFLSQSRATCHYLRPFQPGTLAGATCQLCPRSARYRNEDHRKWLRIDPGGAGFAAVDLLNVDNFAPYVAPGQQRIPLLPLLVALYHDTLPGLPISGSARRDVPDLLSDFNLRVQEFQTYFDDDPTNVDNRRLLTRYPRIRYTQVTTGRLIRRVPRRAGRRPRRGAPAPPAPVLTGTPTAPPGINTGWEAEQFVKTALETHGWRVYDVSRQRLGYDLLAQKRRQTRYVDVKSSLNYCSPSLTAREWQQANVHGSNYILAIIENFDPGSQNSINWVPAPHSNLNPRSRTTVQYFIPRTTWTQFVVPLNSI